ncbi:MAG TPA: urease subunit beta [Tepidiformaceae bacterium]|nr:urease subunit beta [Tepidiformaceae bacterium]
MIFGEGDIELNPGRDVVEMEVTNRGDRAIQVGSHYHFFEVNGALAFPRRAAFGRRLDIPSGTAVRFEAGQTHRVSLVPYGGKQRIYGFRGWTNGKGLKAAVEKARAAGVEIEAEASE